MMNVTWQLRDRTPTPKDNMEHFQQARQRARGGGNTQNPIPCTPFLSSSLFEGLAPFTYQCTPDLLPHHEETWVQERTGQQSMEMSVVKRNREPFASATSGQFSITLYSPRWLVWVAETLVNSRGEWPANTGQRSTAITSRNRKHFVSHNKSITSRLKHFSSVKAQKQTTSQGKTCFNFIHSSSLIFPNSWK